MANVVLYREDGQPLLLRCSKTLGRGMGQVGEAFHSIYHTLCPNQQIQLSHFLARARQEGTIDHGRVLLWCEEGQPLLLRGSKTFVGAWVRSEKLPMLSTILLHIFWRPNHRNLLTPFSARASQEDTPFMEELCCSVRRDNHCF